MDPYLAQNLESLPHDRRQVVENLREIAAGIALDADRRDEELHVEQRHALGKPVERLTHRQAEILLVEHLLELDARRRAQFVSRHADGCLKRMPGPDRPRDEIE